MWGQLRLLTRLNSTDPAPPVYKKPNKQRRVRDSGWVCLETFCNACNVIRFNANRQLRHLKPRANGHNIAGQKLPTLLDFACCVRLHSLLHVVAFCWELLCKVWNSQILPAFPLFRDRRSLFSFHKRSLLFLTVDYLVLIMRTPN